MMDPEKRRKLARRITDLLPAPAEIAQDWGEFIVDVVDPSGVLWRIGQNVS